MTVERDSRRKGSTVSREWALAYVGLLKPYRFERVLAALAATLLGTVLVVTAIGFVLAGELGRHTPRELYFVYLAGLVVVGIAAVPWPKLSALVLVLGTFESAFGIGSFALHRFGLAHSSILPDNFYAGGGFRWHPLLQGAPIRSLKGGVKDLTINHSSEGTRGRDYSEQELRTKAVVAVFGGSTTYDIGVSDKDTWSARLEFALGGHAFAVINHGVLGYSTVENLIQTAFYQTKFGASPRCALYYVGWNDIRNAYIANRDPGYAGYHLPSQIDSLKVRRVGSDYVSVSPLFTMVARQIGLWGDTARPALVPSSEPQAGGDPGLEALFVRNVRSISAINRDRGIRTIWVGQILNVQALLGDGIDGWLPLVRNKDTWPLQMRFNGLLKQTAMGLGDVYIHVPVEDFGSGDFVELGAFFRTRLVKICRSSCVNSEFEPVNESNARGGLSSKSELNAGLPSVSYREFYIDL